MGLSQSRLFPQVRQPKTGMTPFAHIVGDQSVLIDVIGEGTVELGHDRQRLIPGCLWGQTTGLPPMAVDSMKTCGCRDSDYVVLWH